MRRSRRPKTRRSCSPKRSATRSRAPTSRSSTSGSPTRNNGYVVGAYNLIFRTADGGKTWEPWFDRTDNPKFFNLYAIRPAAGELYIAGEGGLVLKLDARGAALQAHSTVPYNGSFFGVADAGTAVARLRPARQRLSAATTRGATWAKVDAGLPASVVGAARTAEGATLLADAGGRVVRERRRRPHVRAARARRSRCRSPASPMPARASSHSSDRAASQSPRRGPR